MQCSGVVDHGDADEMVLFAGNSAFAHAARAKSSDSLIPDNS